MNAKLIFFIFQYKTTGILMHRKFYLRSIGILLTLFVLIMITCVNASETGDRWQAFKDKYFSEQTAEHPKELLKAHPVADFGCLACHQGESDKVASGAGLKLKPDATMPLVPPEFSQGLCLGCHETPAGLKGAEKVDSGRKLFVDRGCYGCHVVKPLGQLPNMSTSLEGASIKIKDANWIAEWIKKPEDVRPGTRMPGFRLAASDIPNVVAYVKSLKETAIPLSTYKANEGKVDEGKRLFTEKGCIGCHSVERGKPGVTPRVPNLSDAGIKLDASWLKTWIEKPIELMPTTPMPMVTLKPEEISHITAYVLTLKDSAVAGLVKTAVAAGDIAKGKETIQNFGCFGCHEIKAMKTNELVGVPLADIAVKKLEELPFGDTKVEKTRWAFLVNKMKKPDLYQTAETPMKMPDYALLDDEVEALTNYYLHNRLFDVGEKYLQPKTKEIALLEKGEWMLDHFNCTGCHQVVEDAPKPRIDTYFELKTMAPPRLVGQGARVQSEWFYNYLEKPDELRPWLNIRMPKFNLDDTGKKDLIAYFSTLVSPDDRDIAKLPYTTKLAKSDYDPEIIDMGEYRIVTDKCMQCHPVSMDGSLPENVKLEDLSINLMLAKSRLRFEWIKRFLKDPDKYAGKGTKMPYIYYTPDGVPKIPDSDMWIDYTSLYLVFMEKVPEVKGNTSAEDAREDADMDWTSY